MTESRVSRIGVEGGVEGVEGVQTCLIWQVGFAIRSNKDLLTLNSAGLLASGFFHAF